jgi:hypothetical protein
MMKVKNMILLMMMPILVTVVCLAWAAYFPNPMM